MAHAHGMQHLAFAKNQQHRILQAQTNYALTGLIMMEMEKQIAQMEAAIQILSAGATSLKTASNTQIMPHALLMTANGLTILMGDGATSQLLHAGSMTETKQHVQDNLIATGTLQHLDLG